MENPEGKILSNHLFFVRGTERDGNTTYAIAQRKEGFQATDTAWWRDSCWLRSSALLSAAPIKRVQPFPNTFSGGGRERFCDGDAYHCPDADSDPNARLQAYAYYAAGLQLSHSVHQLG